MKKNLLLLCMSFLLMGGVFAQTLTKDYTYTPTGEAPLQVNKNNPDSFTAATIEKCATVENMEDLRRRNPNWESIDEFEEWMEQKIAERQLQPSSNAFNGTIIRIPYVVHIIHDGEPINTPGNVVGDNLSAAQVYSQQRVLTEDFRKLNPDRANSPEWDDVAADMELEFLPALRHPDTGIPLDEPGIHRVDRNDFGWPAPPFNTSFIESDIKPATSWNWEKVLNIWVMQLPGGLYGYAQFPSSSTLPGMPNNGGGADTDGVVIAPFTFGSSVDDDGSFTTDPQQLGRTTTHEVGHWVGLRHIWGDGDCSADDFCDDTPRASSSHPFGSCIAGYNSCDDTAYGAAEDLPDMKENFMDYSADACMNLFSECQVMRAEVVFENSPGRGGLIDSDVLDPAAPEIGFYPTEFATVENLALEVEDQCEKYKDITIKARLIGDATGGSPSISVEVDASTTATEGEDFEIITDPLTYTFDGGVNGSFDVIVRVFDDAVSEGDETVVLNITNFDDGGSDAYVSSDNEQFTLTIVDNDYAPSNDNTPIILVNENFESGLSDWTAASITVGDNNWIFGDAPDLEGNSAYISDDGSSFAYNGTSETWTLLFSDLVSFDGAESGELTFDWIGEGEYLNFFGLDFWFDYGRVGLINEAFTTIYFLTPELGLATSPETFSLNVPDQFLTGNWHFAFSWENDNSVSGDTPFAVDNAYLATIQPVAFETELTGDGSAYVNIGPNSTVQVYSAESAGNELIATISNNSSHDYGCTKIEVDRAGLGSADFYTLSCGNEQAVIKTISVTPENESEENFDITLYYTNQELEAWEEATGLSTDDLYIVHTESSISSVDNGGASAEFASATVEEFNNYGKGFTGSFNSNLGTGFGLVPASSIGVVGVNAEQQDETVVVSWTVPFSDVDLDYYVVEKSEDNGATWFDFEVVNYTGAGDYSVTDMYPVAGGNFYRLKALTPSCGVLYTDEAYVNFVYTNETKVYPNPAIDDVTVEISRSDIKGATSVTIYDEEGQIVMEREIQSLSGVFRWTFDVSSLGAGVYYVNVTSSAGGKQVATFVKAN